MQFSTILKTYGTVSVLLLIILLSMNGSSTAYANVFIQVLWCSLGALFIGTLGFIVKNNYLGFFVALLASSIFWWLLSWVHYSFSRIGCGEHCIPGITTSEISNTALFIAAVCMVLFITPAFLVYLVSIDKKE